MSVKTRRKWKNIAKNPGLLHIAENFLRKIKGIGNEQFNGQDTHIWKKIYLCTFLDV